MHLFIYDIHRLLCEADIPPESTIKDLKIDVANKIKENFVDTFSIVYRGRVLEDDKTLSSYSIRDGYKLFISFTKSAISAKQRQLSKQENSDPFTNFMKMAGKSVSKMMETNPEMFSQLVQSNPALKQFADQNPEIQHAFNDTDMLSDQISKFVNPDNRAETAKSIDNMLDYIDSIPGGSKALNHQMSLLGNPMDLMNNMFTAPEIKTNLDLKPLDKPADEPLPFQDKPQQTSSFPNLFDQFPGFFPMNSSSQQQIPLNAQNPKATQIPYEAMHLINQGIERCRLKGLNVAEFPGFSELVDVCAKNDPYGASDLNIVFASQLKRLSEMGFLDTEKNIKMLVKTHGDFNQALECLISDQVSTFS